MGTHLWGEEDFDWESLSKAITLVCGTMRRYGRIGVHGKEKYGTCRAYIYFYSGGLFSLCKPGYVSMWVWPAWLRWCEYKIFEPATRILSLHRPIQWWQRKVYNWAYQRAIKKYPHIAEEIVEDADYPELISEWHRVMAPSWQKSNEYLAERWHKTSEFYERAMRLLPDSEEKTKLQTEYEEFDRL